MYSLRISCTYVALKNVNDEYTEKLSSSKSTSDKVMYQLCWSVDELTRLLKEGRVLYVEVSLLLDILSDDQRDKSKPMWHHELLSCRAV